MTKEATAIEVLDKEFLEVRAKLLELAAALDRIDRAEGGIGEDSRMLRILEALTVIRDPGPDRAEQVQLIFSRPYDDAWRDKYLAAR